MIVMAGCAQAGNTTYPDLKMVYCTHEPIIHDVTGDYDMPTNMQRALVDGFLNTSISVRQDGTVMVDNGIFDDYDCRDWEDIISVSVGDTFVAGLKTDGTVVTEGRLLPFDVTQWHHVTMLETPSIGIFGLLTDGTIIAATDEDMTPKQEAVMEEVAGWQDIIYISSSYDGLVGVKSNGKIVIASFYDEEFLDEEEAWESIQTADISSYLIAGLKDNGEVVWGLADTSYTIDERQRKVDLETLYGAKKIAVGVTFVAALMHDGTIKAKQVRDFDRGETFDFLSEETGIADINCSGDYLYALKDDGSVVIGGKVLPE
jgi:alpha-tubulin suppressor-like RCC1 family protein